MLLYNFQMIHTRALLTEAEVFQESMENVESLAVCQVSRSLREDWDPYAHIPLLSHCPEFTLGSGNMERSSVMAVCSSTLLLGEAEILP